MLKQKCAKPLKYCRKLQLSQYHGILKLHRSSTKLNNLLLICIPSLFENEVYINQHKEKTSSVRGLNLWSSCDKELLAVYVNCKRVVNRSKSFSPQLFSQYLVLQLFLCGFWMCIPTAVTRVHWVDWTEEQEVSVYELRGHLRGNKWEVWQKSARSEFAYAMFGSRPWAQHDACWSKTEAWAHSERSL